MADLSTHFAGLKLKNPLVVGASPFSRNLELSRLLEDQGAAGIVMYSLFEEEVTNEQLATDHFLNVGTESQPEAQTYLVEPPVMEDKAERYMDQIRALKSALSIPVIASLNGFSKSGWVSLASRMEAAGADAVELNLYSVVTDPDVSSEQVVQGYLEMMRQVRSHTKLPLAIKISSHFKDLPRVLKLASETGVDGFVLFNRFLQPDIDIEKMTVNLKARLSTSDDLAQSIVWTAIVSPEIDKDIVVCSGVHTAQDVVKAIMAGGCAVTMVSELIKHGPRAVGKVLTDLNAWMDMHNYPDINSMRGAMARGRGEHSIAYERRNYMQALQSYNENLL